MLWKFFAFAFVLFGWLTVDCVSAESPTDRSDSEVIVLVAPSINEPYYSSVFDRIIAYDINFVNTVSPHIPVVLLVDQATLPYVQGQVPEANLHIANVGDIWVRDFSPVFPDQPVKFRYRPNYLPMDDARWIENSFLNMIDDLGINFAASNIKLDGGNFVHNAVDKAVVTTRIFDDNPGLTAAEFEQELFDLAGITAVAYTPEEEGDTTGHSDGQVMWLDADTLIVNEYDEPFRTEMLTPLQAAFPDVTIIELPVDYTEAYFGDFASACGLHVNSLVTDDLIILPLYGQDNDAVAHAIIEANTDKTVVPVDASEVCIMGGAVRCLTWYAKGAQADALLSEVTPTAVSLSSLQSGQPNNIWSILFSMLTLSAVTIVKLGGVQPQ